MAPKKPKKTKLAEWRERRGVTQEELARATGISRSVYWRLEKGRIDNPPLRYLVNLQIALGVPTLEELCEKEWLEWCVLDAWRAPAPPDAGQFWR